MRKGIAATARHTKARRTPMAITTWRPSSLRCRHVCRVNGRRPNRRRGPTCAPSRPESNEGAEHHYRSGDPHPHDKRVNQYSESDRTVGEEIVGNDVDILQGGGADCGAGGPQAESRIEGLLGLKMPNDSPSSFEISTLAMRSVWSGKSLCSVSRYVIVYPAASAL